MNRIRVREGKRKIHVPRRRGDEPNYFFKLLFYLLCSPQARG